jgi:hypothetical protein
LQPANLIATVPASVYADPSLLWNAQPASAPTLKVVGNQLTITTATTVASGAYTVQVTASDGAVMATTTFTLTIQANTAPQITALASRKLGANRSQTLTVNATDAQNDVIRYSARIVGTFAKPPATLLVSGNQLTIYTSPNFTGSFDVQVTASDGKLATTSTMHVTVPAATGIQRFSGDVNGDGRADTIFFNPDGSWWVSMPKADGSFVNQQWAKWSPATNWRLAQVGDLGGDGKTDIVGFSTAGTWCVGTSDGARFNTKVWATWSAASAYSMVQVGDFNGDHKTDILGFATSGAIYVGVNNGAAFATSQWGQIAAASFWIDVRAIDVDHDGKLDFAARTVSGTWYTGFSTGRAFRTPMTPSAKPPV